MYISPPIISFIPQVQDGTSAGGGGGGTSGDYYDQQQQYMYGGPTTHSIFNPTGPQYTPESFMAGATPMAGGKPPMQPMYLGSRRQPTELPQVSLELVRKRLAERYSIDRHCYRYLAILLIYY